MKWTHKLVDQDGFWWMAAVVGKTIFFSELYNRYDKPVEPEETANLMDGELSVEDFYSELKYIHVVKLASFKGNL